MDGHMKGIEAILLNYWHKYPFFTWDMTLTNSIAADA
jgi:hypothetical protein